MEEERERENTATLVVARLIENATNSTAAEVDPRVLKAIKSVVRYSDSELQLAAQTLMALMKRDHSQVRYLALLIIDELFMRSKLFRTLLVEKLDQLLSLSVGFRRNLPLPAPASVASILRSKAIEFLEKWNESFGIHYRQLRLGYDYLKNTLRLQFPNLQANAARIQRERREREMRTNEILLKKFEALKDNLVSIKAEIQSTIEEIDECLHIVKKEDEDMPLVPTDDEEIEEFRNSELRQIRLDSLKEGERVQENTENKVVFDTLRELYKVLLSKHLTAIQEWTTILIRVEAADNRFRDSTLKEFIDIRNRIQSVMRKCEELGCTLKIANDEEEGLWEEGSLESFVSGRSGIMFFQSNDCTPASTSNDVRSEDLRFSDENSNGKGKEHHDRSGSESDPLRKKLLDEAPVVKWGSFLNNWGSNQDVLANQRGLDLEGHWGRVDNNAVIPAEKIAELNVQASVYKEDPIEIQPCRAPLRKGGLCQRRDLRECPFHGLIIPRDDDGKPINQSPSVQETASQYQEEERTPDLESNTMEQTASQYQEEERTPDLESNTMEQLFNQAVKNVRERDKEETKKKEYDKKSLKRAKLAEVRKHNEAVLRDAALASTSRSAHIGEDKEMLNGSKSSTKKKKQTLASMLKKKEAAKDRLAQRLLNTRVSESTTRQLTVAEDANYREAFPNQW